MLRNVIFGSVASAIYGVQGSALFVTFFITSMQLSSSKRWRRALPSFFYLLSSQFLVLVSLQTGMASKRWEKLEKNEKF